MNEPRRPAHVAEGGLPGVLASAVNPHGYRPGQEIVTCRPDRVRRCCALRRRDIEGSLEPITAGKHRTGGERRYAAHDQPSAAASVRSAPRPAILAPRNGPGGGEGRGEGPERNLPALKTTAVSNGKAAF